MTNRSASLSTVPLSTVTVAGMVFVLALAAPPPAAGDGGSGGRAGYHGHQTQGHRSHGHQTQGHRSHGHRTVYRYPAHRQPVHPQPVYRHRAADYGPSYIAPFRTHRYVYPSHGSVPYRVPIYPYGGGTLPITGQLLITGSPSYPATLPQYEPQYPPQYEPQYAPQQAPQTIIIIQQPAVPAPPARVAVETPPRARNPNAIRESRADPGEVYLWIEQPDAAAYLDDEFLGSAHSVASLRQPLEMAAGVHVLEVRHPDYPPERLIFATPPGGELLIEIDLAGDRRGRKARLRSTFEVEARLKLLRAAVPAR